MTDTKCARQPTGGIAAPIKLDRSMKRGGRRGGFGIEVLYPGLALGADDSGIAAIGRIDHARIPAGHVIRMHPHRDDEILTYVRQGGMLHRDTVGDQAEITRSRLMLMNAGHTFEHEEKIPGPQPLECLQIFIRPQAADLGPKVQFHDFGESLSRNSWRLIAGPRGAPLQLRAEAWIQDAHLAAGTKLALPVRPTSSIARLLYLFAGEARIGRDVLADGESLILGADEPVVEAHCDADLVLFSTDLTAPSFKGGMFSGNILAG